MNKGLSKVVMNKSRLTKIYLEWPSIENLLPYNEAKSKCNSLTRKTKRKCFVNIGKAESKSFWNSIKSFITNKCTVSEESIETDEIRKAEDKYDEISIKANDLRNYDKVLAKMFK